MNSDQLQRMIDKAHTRVAKMMGQEFYHIRPLRNVRVLNDENKLRTVKLSATLNDSYTSTSTWGLPVWTLYTEAEGVEEGDFFHNEENDRTYFVVSRKPHLPIVGMEAPARFTIRRIEYGSDFTPTEGEIVAESVPGIYSMGASSFAAGTPARNNGSTGMRNMQVITTFPHPENLIGAVLSDNQGFRGMITSYEISPIGSAIRISAQEMELT